MTKDEALRLALGALKAAIKSDDDCDFMNSEVAALTDDAITACEAALEAKDEPVAWRWIPSKIWGSYVLSDDPAKAELAQEHAIEVQPLYTTPPQRKPLSEEEIGAILEDVNAYGTRLYTFARAIEAAHGIKGEA